MPRGKSQHRRKAKTHTKPKPPPHGRDVFQSHCGCMTCILKRVGIHRLVNSFSQISRRCIQAMAEQSEIDLPLPKGGKVWVPSDPVCAVRIRGLCLPITGADDDEELKRLQSAGWKEVANTGVLAVDFHGALILGIHGAGYNFFPVHWEPLYDALEIDWHL